MRSFWEHGYRDTSIVDLTAATGVNAPSLYAAFGSKQELFREAVDRYDRLAGAATEQALRDAPSARAAVAALLRSHADAYTDPANPRGCLVVLAAAEWTGDADDAAYLARMREQTAVALRERLARDVTAGDLPADAEVGLLALYVDTLLAGLSLQARAGASRATVQGVIDCAMAGWDACVSAGRRRA